MRSLILLGFITPFLSAAQVLIPTVITPLSTTLNETSGLLVLNGEVWTQLDSGNPNALYRIDPGNGEVLRTVTVSNASNVDWEEITTDGTWLYIGDFGNNMGSRTDLRVYRVSLAELLDPGTSALLADTIRFSYPLQTDFTPADRANDWDMEAMIAVDDTLFLFSKNWVSRNSYLYALSAEPGDQLAIRRDTLPAQGIITGATYSPSTGGIALIGYSVGEYQPFIWRLAQYPGHAFFRGIAQRDVLVSGFTQMEGIAWAAADTVYMTNEFSTLNVARLWALPLDPLMGISSHARIAHRLWPSPNDGRFSMETNAPCRMELFDMDGRFRAVWDLRPGINQMDLSDLPNGIYLVRTGPGNGVVRMSVVH
ncbi:MAG: T9SS type A sorting domain-containing protein [Flavobacteriales bacterium]